MKMRIKGDSLRLRLTQTEVAELAESGSVRERTRFGPHRALVYELVADPAAERIAAALDDDTIRVILPAALAADWSTSDEVSLHGCQSLPDGELRLLVEKDFQCLKPREDEDESDMFPHPQAS